MGSTFFLLWKSSTAFGTNHKKGTKFSWELMKESSKISLPTIIIRFIQQKHLVMFWKTSWLSQHLTWGRFWKNASKANYSHELMASVMLMEYRLVEKGSFPPGSLCASLCTHVKSCDTPASFVTFSPEQLKWLDKSCESRWPLVAQARWDLVIPTSCFWV